MQCKTLEVLLRQQDPVSGAAGWCLSCPACSSGCPYNTCRGPNVEQQLWRVLTCSIPCRALRHSFQPDTSVFLVALDLLKIQGVYFCCLQLKIVTGSYAYTISIISVSQKCMRRAAVLLTGTTKLMRVFIQMAFIEITWLRR